MRHWIEEFEQQSIGNDIIGIIIVGFLVISVILGAW